MADDDLDEAAAPVEAAKYTSVVYVHGMGDQRRYEETSRLIDRIDTYLFNRFRDSKGAIPGVLARIKARVEPCRVENATDSIVGYIRTTLVDTPKMENPRNVRFYEVYWAPVMAEQKSAWAVVKWMFAQVLRPWHTLRARWRERQRLRRAALAALIERKDKLPAGATDADYQRLARLYDDFEGLEAQRDYPGGHFSQFLLFVGNRLKDQPDVAKRCHALAEAWLNAYKVEELRNAAVLITMALTLVLAGGAVVVGILIGLQAFADFGPVYELLADWKIPFVPDWKTAAAVAAGLFSFAGLAHFFTSYMGDVQAWATYEETDSKHVARNKVLDQTLAVLTHVLTDPDCERVAVVAHSLGTSVAHDALLALTRRNRAFNPQNAMEGVAPLDKIEHFITMGSPIDKIEYFFESYSSASHRYKRVVETLRGDIGTEPFSKNRKPHVHWVNFWDQGDVISGALQSPASGAVFAQRVDNVLVASFDFPSPGKSHGGYFDNKTVIQNIFEMIYLRARSFRTVPQPNPNAAPDYASAYLGPGESRGGRIGLFALVLLSPWVVAVALLAWTFSGATLLYCSLAILLLFAIILILSARVSKRRGQREPL